MCISNDNAQIVPTQKFIVLTDGSRIALSDERKKLFSVWDDYFEDHPEFTDIPVGFDLKTYEQLAMVIQSEGKVMPTCREEIQNLFVHAHRSDLQKKYLKYIANHAIYNFKEFALASSDVQKNLSDALGNDHYKIYRLVRDEFDDTEWPEKFFNFPFLTTAHYLGHFAAQWRIGSRAKKILLFSLNDIFSKCPEKKIHTSDLKNLKKFSCVLKYDSISQIRIQELGTKLVIQEDDLLHILDVQNNEKIILRDNDFRSRTKIVYDKKGQKAYVYYNYHNGFNGIQIREWDLANLNEESLKNARIIFDRVLTNPLLDIYWDECFDELQWAYSIGSYPSTLMCCTYKSGLQPSMKEMKCLEKTLNLCEFVGNRILQLEYNYESLGLDMITGVLGELDMKNPHSPNGALSVSYRYLNCYGGQIKYLGNSENMQFISNRFLQKDDNTLVDLKQLKDAYKVLTGNKFYMKRITEPYVPRSIYTRGGRR